MEYDEGFERVGKYIRETFTDKEKTKESITGTITEWLQEQDFYDYLVNLTNEEGAQSHIKWMLKIALRNVDFIFEKAESPIELIFFNTINSLAFGNGRLLNFTSQLIFSDEDESYISEKTRRAQKLLDHYIETHPRDPLALYIQEWARETGDYTEEYCQWLYHRSCDNFYDARYITMQTEFPDVIPNTVFPIRVDGLVWTFDLDLKLVVECDGFEYHKDKSLFIRDRQRDRFFRKKGFDVLRFTGTEINHDPSGCAVQLINYIWKYDESEDESQ